MHEKHESMAKRSNLEYILCGDSIVAGLSRYSDIWRKFFAPLHALNLGIGGDRTQHVLWRAENLDISPNTKFVVLHCGTNNIDRDTPSCIANGILSIAVTFQEKVPDLKVVVTGLLPRDLHQSSYRRDKIKKVNKIVKKMCRRDFEGVYYMKQDDDWVVEDGQLDESLYFTDHLHLIEKGNIKLATSIIDMLDKLKKDGCVEYSSDEDDDSDSDDANYQYQRLLSQKRKRDVDSDDNDYSHSRSEKRRRQSDDHHHRRSSSHRSSSSSKRSRHSYGSSSSRDRHRDENETSSWKKARERGISSLKDRGLSSGSGLKKDEDRDSFDKSKDRKLSPVRLNNGTRDRGLAAVSQQEVANEKDQEFSGTAKSIDITLDQRKRLEARRNKFAAPALLAPSSLMRKIQDNQKKDSEKKDSQKHIDLKRKSIKHVSSNKPPIDEKPPTELTEEEIKTKKFFSDFTADSDSE